MELSLLLPESHILLGLQGDTPEAIVRTLSQPLLDDGVISDLDAFVRDVLEREKVFTTQVTDNVAFPHAHSDQVRQIALVVGITDGRGLAYDPHSPNRCRLFLLIAVPSSDPESHLELMANLVDFVMSDKLDAALAVTSKADFLKLVSEHA